jgi:hypothetical protein
VARLLVALRTTFPVFPGLFVARTAMSRLATLKCTAWTSNVITAHFEPIECVQSYIVFQERFEDTSIISNRRQPLRGKR